MMDYGIKDMVFGYQQIIENTIENTGSDSKLTKRTLDTFELMLRTLLPTKFFARYRINDIDDLLIFDEERDRDNWINDVYDDIDEDDDLKYAECQAISYEDFIDMAGKDLFDPDHYSEDTDGKGFGWYGYGALILS